MRTYFLSKKRGNFGHWPLCVRGFSKIYFICMTKKTVVEPLERPKSCKGDDKAIFWCSVYKGVRLRPPPPHKKTSFLEHAKLLLEGGVYYNFLDLFLLIMHMMNALKDLGKITTKKHYTMCSFFLDNFARLIVTFFFFLKFHLGKHIQILHHD